ncbi:MAG: lactate utilization protein, partial [Alphaproteobacteria bacterium]|nr:lactate utilization protein [Alphaproteobacteria bacterium]
MHGASSRFKDNARRAMADKNLRFALNRLASGFPQKRLEAIADLPEFGALTERAREIKDHVLAHLDVYLAEFEGKVVASGGQVHWCRDAEEARQAVLAICRRVEAKTVTKGKTMIGEEVGLNRFLEANGIRPVETDLGEYIIQLAGEAPSHIIAPAVHKTKAQVSDLFQKHHGKYGKTKRLEDEGEMVAEAREILRPQYYAADVGITGANFLI